MSAPLTVRRRRCAAFTLVELLVVIVIVAILAAILIPVIGRVRANAKQSACLSNLRQIGVAWHLYLGENRGVFPSFTTYDMYHWGGRAALWGGPPTMQRPLYPYLPDARIFQCPADNGYTGSASAATFHGVSGNSYVMSNSRERGILRREAEGSRMPLSGVYAQLQNPPKTILVYEQTVRNSEPGYKTMTPLVYWHPKDASNLLMADGHVEVFTREVLDEYANPRNPPGYSWGWSAWSGTDW